MEAVEGQKDMRVEGQKDMRVERQKDTKVIGEEGGREVLSGSQTTQHYVTKGRGLVGTKCNRALVFMSTRALRPSISPGL